MFVSGQQELTQAEMIEDLEFLKGALTTTHPSFGRYTHPDSIYQKIEQLIQDVRNDELDYPFRVQVASVLNDIHCIHTYLFSDRVRKRDARKPTFIPLAVFFDGKDLWVSEVYLDSLKQIKGKRIDSIDHKPVRDIVKPILKYRSGDGTSDAFSQAYFNYRVNFSTLYRYYFQPDTLITMHLSSGDKPGKDVCIPYTNFTIKRKKDQSPKPIFRTRNRKFHLDSTLHIGILTISSFNPPKKSRRFYKDVISYLNDNDIQDLVIDLRNNTGGNIHEAERLLSYLIDTTMYYTLERKKTNLGKYGTFMSNWYLIANFFKRKVFSFDRRYRRDEWFVIDQKTKVNRRYHYDGQVYVLQNGLTSSSSTVTSSYLKKHIGATIIGGESGGGAYGNNGLFYATSKLPNSKIRIRMPQYWLDYHLGADNGRGVRPDIEIKYRIQDVLLERDLEMEQVRRIIIKNRNL